MILVTGGCGYLGSQLLHDLTCGEVAGCQTVRVLDNLQGGGHRSLMKLSAEEGALQFIEGDILDPAVVRAALRDVEVVIHLASIVHTPMGYENPTWVEQVNHWGTMRLLEQCLEEGISRFVYASSIAVYGPTSAGDYLLSEQDDCQPLGPYAHSKMNAEKSVEGAGERGLDTTILRFGTIHGYAPGVRFDAVANRFAYYASTGRALTVHGNGNQKRTFVHVGDASNAVCFCLTNPEETAGHTFNVTAENKSIMEIIDVVRSVRPEVKIKYTKQNEVARFNFCANGKKFENAGWRPEWDLHDGIAGLVGRFGRFDRPRL